MLRLLATGGVHGVDSLHGVEVYLQVLQQARFCGFPTQPLSDDPPAALVPSQRLLRPPPGHPSVADRLPHGRSAAQYTTLSSSARGCIHVSMLQCVFSVCVSDSANPAEVHSPFSPILLRRFLFCLVVLAYNMYHKDMK